jgi:DNA-binding IclR family transcriptional regulator
VRNDRRIAGAKIVDAGDLAERVDRIRHLGFSHSSSEIIPAVDAFSAPIFEHEGNIIGALTLLTATTEITASSRAKIEKILLIASDGLSRALGYSGPGGRESP